MTNQYFNLTEVDFVKFFCPQNFIFGTTWLPTNTYQRGDIVFYNNLSYTSVIDNNTSIPTEQTYPLNWNLTQSANIITSSKIQEAFLSALSYNNPALFRLSMNSQGQFIPGDNPPQPDQEIKDYTPAQATWLKVVAHFVACQQTAINNQGSPNISRVSMSVDGMSASYGLSPQVVKNLALHELYTTEYGRAFITLTAPQLKATSLVGFVNPYTDC